MNLICLDLPENWLYYRMEHGEFRNVMKKGGHQDNFGDIKF